jgi:hypothetical protein
MNRQSSYDSELRMVLTLQGSRSDLSFQQEGGDYRSANRRLCFWHPARPCSLDHARDNPKVIYGQPPRLIARTKAEG